MGGHWDPKRGRYVTADEAEGQQRPFDRGRRDCMAVAREIMKFGEDAPSFASIADDERAPLKGAARTMLAMAEHGADPQAISARLADDRELLNENDIGSPEINAELVGALAEEADDRVRDVRQEREAAEMEQAFDDWLEQTYDVEELRKAIAEMDDDEAQEAIEAVADEFEAATGVDSSGIASINDNLEAEFRPHSFDDDDAGEPAGND